MRVKVLAVGDILLLFGFVLLGRASHSERDSFTAFLATAVPFIAGWSLSALAWGSYGPEALAGYRRAFLIVFRTWGVGCLIALVLRSLEERRFVPVSFAAVAFIFNLLTLGTWRSLLLGLSDRARFRN